MRERYLIRLKRWNRKAVVTMPNGELFDDRERAIQVAMNSLVMCGGIWRSYVIETVYPEPHHGCLELIEVAK